MNLKEIKDMINLMNENDIAEIEVEREGTKIKIKKSSPEFSEHIFRQPPGYVMANPPAAKEIESPAVAINSNRREIKSPMVGTFYRSPSPDSPSFVEIGQVIEVGQVVCIVEAMKLMNEIKAEIRGKVVEIPVDNAQPVEFGQVLFALEPA